MTKEQQEAEILNQEVKYYEGIMKGLSISKVLLSEGKMTNRNIEVEMNRYSPELMHRYQLQDFLSDPEPTALDLIAAEREKQISKGYTVEHDEHCNPECQLAAIASDLCFPYEIEQASEPPVPINWNPGYWKKLINLPYKDRLRIAGGYACKGTGKNYSTSKQRTMIYLTDEYYDDIYELLEKLTDYSDDPETLAEFRENFPDGITVQDCKEVPLMNTTKEGIFSALLDSVDADYWPEDSDREEAELTDVLNKFLSSVSDQLKALSAAMPKVWMPNGEKTHYSLKELEEMLCS